MRYQMIPKSRIGVLIGKDGETRESIEKSTGVKLTIDSESGEVEIDDTNADPFLALKAEDVVKAIGRGFSPKRAFRLFEEDVIMEIIDLKDYYGKRENRIRIARGRIIGTNGKARRTIEDFTGTYISVFGNTVAIIGSYEGMEIARKSIEMILQGSKHSTIYRFLAEKRREMKFSSLDSY
ncbi:MAG: KH domain-containing protein [Thermoplasmata archaeon]|jgi:ribosomal RNA assembly protein|nr:RNA-processing protein [Thermoplasmatales archaeon]PMP73979.1 MAG: RNA-processing protein [Aciduliprofundum sp.]HEU12541.1 RNA-processing protein [Euryarchaeota archaeon]